MKYACPVNRWKETNRGTEMFVPTRLTKCGAPSALVMYIRYIAVGSRFSR